MPQPAIQDDDEILPALLPPMDGARFPDDFLLLDDLTPAVQVLADTVAASGPIDHEPPVLRLKILDDAEREAAPRPTVEELEPPLNVHDWGPGPLGQFCCTVADWSDTLADWIDRWNAALGRARVWAAGCRDRVVAWFHRSR